MKRFHAGDYADCVGAGKDVYDDAVRANVPDVSAAAAAIVALSLSNEHLDDAVASWAERALSVYVAFGNREHAPVAVIQRLDDSAAMAWVALAAYHAFQGSVPEALRAMTAAQVSLTATSSASARVVVHTGLGIAYYRMGLPMQALDALRRALDAADVQMPPTRLLRLTLNVLFASFDAHDLLSDSDPAEAAQLVQAMLADRAAAEQLCRTINTEAAWAAFAPAAAAASFRAGDFAAARHWLEPVLQDGRMRPQEQEFETYALLALIEQALGNEEGARAAAEQGRVLIEQVDLARATPNRLWYASRLAMVSGDLKRAMALCHRQLGLVVRNHNTALGARMAQLSASLYVQAAKHSKPGDARAAWSAAQQDHADVLTGLVNRQQLERAFTRLQEDGEPMTLVLLDVDEFRQINLRHGYGVGDQVLYQMARLTQSALRSQDVLARLSGKTFALLMPSVNASAASVIVRRIRQRVSKHNWPQLTPGLAQVSFSGGMVEVQEGEPLADALMRADALVRAAKRAGRMRVYYGRLSEGGTAEVF